MDEVELINRFKYHPPKDLEQINKYRKIREAQILIGSIINEICVESREKSLAITKLEEVGFWANASVDREFIDE